MLLSAPSDDLAATFAHRVAEHDNPPPPSQEPAAVQARLEAWLRAAHGLRDPRGRGRLAHMLLALLQHPTRTTQELIAAAGLSARAGTRTADRLTHLHLATWEHRSYWRDWRLLPATEAALLLLVAGPPAPLK